ncbi:UbiA prenyltransferase [Fomitiporia mediterranea MF3/22]|uniref:UbiA prenyltransferase n=1 Tax=Fomitiporia mediterranea (strain MF3/22) TaxID=694068 RepID=UPI0004407F5F|nr:UbiA prenyltransferase [Fomitiporia mediterranea MF3/22]EJC99745.1 UbiA prenyltransferase [Fomitiporia mediterranea MF3/22]
MASASIRPYLELMRVHKPAGWLFFLWPFAWGLTMAAYSTRLAYQDYAVLLAKSLFGSFIMRTSACTVNDIFDRDFDASVERCKSRPLPSGRISVSAAWVFFFLQVAVGLWFFAGYTDQAFVASVVQMLPLLCIYPLMKRITYWPQAWLGIAINFGFIVSWLSVKGAGSPTSPVNTYMLIGLWCWSMVYDTIYGCQDRKDDLKAGVWSTAVLFGRFVLPAVVLFAVGFVVALLAAGLANNQGPPFFAGVLGAATYLAWQLYIVDVDSPPSCWMIYAGMVLDYVYAMEKPVRVF